MEVSLAQQKLQGVFFPQLAPTCCRGILVGGTAALFFFNSDCYLFTLGRPPTALGFCMNFRCLLCRRYSKCSDDLYKPQGDFYKHCSAAVDNIRSESLLGASGSLDVTALRIFIFVFIYFYPAFKLIVKKGIGTIWYCANLNLPRNNYSSFLPFWK